MMPEWPAAAEENLPLRFTSHETIVMKGFRVISLSHFFNGFRGKPRIFLSFDHEKDQEWYEKFTGIFSESYHILGADSFDMQIQGGDLTCRQRKTVRKWIAKTSMTVVLCGRDTFKHRCVDWAIYYTLLKRHGLLGIVLPAAEEAARQLALIVGTHGIELDWHKFIIPPAPLWSNLVTGYANRISWTTDPRILSGGIEEAQRRAGKPWLIFKNPGMIEREMAG